MMDEAKNQKPRIKLLILILAAVVILAAVLILVLRDPDQATTEPGTETTVSIPEASGDATEAWEDEVPAVPLPTKYIILSYPEEIQGDVEVSYEDLQDGQRIIFKTGFTGEELELFQFVISKSESEGYLLGTLEDEQAGKLFVCVNVTEYSDGNWEVADYAKLNSLQERVNDIILQFHKDSRFTPSKPQ